MYRVLIPFALAAFGTARLHGQNIQPAGFAAHRPFRMAASDGDFIPHPLPTPVFADSGRRSLGKWVMIGGLGGIVVGTAVVMVDMARTDGGMIFPPLAMIIGGIGGGVAGGILGATAWAVTHIRPSQLSPQCRGPNGRLVLELEHERDSSSP